MLFLLLAVLASAAFGACLKISELQGRDRIVVAFFNYVGGAICACVYWLTPYAEAQATISLATVWTGAFAGITWVAGLLTMMVCIREAGITLTAAIGRLAVVLPMVVCVLAWDEKVGALDGSGAAIAVVAVLLLSTRAGRRDGKVTARGILVLALLFISQGFGNLSLKIFERYAPGNEVAPFVMVLFFTAAVLTGVWMLLARSKVRRQDILFGSLIGVPNLLSGSFLTLALLEINGAIAFPVASVGSLFLIALLGVGVWKEKLGKRGVAGIALTVIAIILINIGR